MSSAVVARIALFVYVLSVGVRLAAARPEFTNLVPNGDNVPTCSHIGHNDCKSGAPRNQFGKDFAAAGMKWTKALCEKDSDGDGVTNGEELGDPCCTWTKANGGAKGFRSSGLSHPGDAGDKAAKSQPKCADANKSDSPTTTTPSGASSGSSSSTAAPTTTTSSSSNNVWYELPCAWLPDFPCLPEMCNVLTRSVFFPFVNILFFFLSFSTCSNVASRLRRWLSFLRAPWSLSRPCQSAILSELDLARTTIPLSSCSLTRIRMPPITSLSSKQHPARP